MPAIRSLDDLLRLDLEAACQQWESIEGRQDYADIPRQSDFTAVEVVLSQGASQLVKHSRFGGSTSQNAPEPVQLLGTLFRRPPSSVLAKMANLDGSRPNGGKYDHAAGLVWSADMQRFGTVYATAVLAARRNGIDADRLPDFLAPGWQQ